MIEDDVIFSDQPLIPDNKYINVPLSISSNKNLSGNEKLILSEIISYELLNKEFFGRNCYLADLVGLSQSAVNKVIRSLKNKGYIKITKIFDSSTQKFKKRVIRSTNDPIEDITSKIILNIFKQHCSDLFFHHDTNTFLIDKRVREIKKISSNLRSPKTGKLLDLTDRRFWNKYFWICGKSSYLKKKQNGYFAHKLHCHDLLSLTNFNKIIERIYN